MALDGAFLRCLKNEIEEWGIGARVDKIAQPSKEELVIGLRQPGDSRRLLVCSGAGSPRVHFTEAKIENPKINTNFREWYLYIMSEFWQWARTLPNYDPMLLYRITFDPNFLNEI